MVQKGLGGFFEKFLLKESVFSDKKVLQSSYTPENIFHREKQIEQIASILGPALKLERPSNLFLYGKTGTGKTVSVKYTTNSIVKVAEEQNIPLKVVYVNCKLKKIADTEYRVIAALIREFGKEIAATGLPTDEVYKIFYSIVDEKKQIVILVLDEIDELVKKCGDEVLYNLTRINEELKNAQISIIGISNDLVFVDTIDPRVKSSLSEEEIIFPPYNAIQLQQILRDRASIAFKPNVIEEGVIEKCAAYAARDHGDARRALELLRVAGEIADRDGFFKVSISHLDLAEEKIEKDRIIDIIMNQPKQIQAVLYSAYLLGMKRKEPILTGEIYEIYKGVCVQTKLNPLTQRRVSDIIAELDMHGIINAKVISKGRYGRTREILLSTPESLNAKIKKILEEGLELA